MSLRKRSINLSIKEKLACTPLCLTIFHRKKRFTETFREFLLHFIFYILYKIWNAAETYSLRSISFRYFIPLTIWDAGWTGKRRARRDRRCRRSSVVGIPRYQASRVASSSPPSSSSSSIQQAGDREFTSHLTPNHRATRPICSAIAASKQRRPTTPTSASRAASTSALTAVILALLIAFVVHSSATLPTTPLVAVMVFSWLSPTT